MLMRHEARDHNANAVTESFRAMFKRKMMLEKDYEGEESGLNSRFKIKRSTPGGPDPHHH